MTISRKLSRGTSFILAMVIMLSVPATCFARIGDSGYEGGISSGEAPNKKSFTYQEPCFLTGVPVILSGTVIITKAMKTDAKTNSQIVTTTYKYSSPATSTAKLTRNLTYVTTIKVDETGQKTESTQLTKANETISINGVNYTISSVDNYELSKSILNDIRPAINYYSGTLWSKKTYTVSAGTGVRAQDTIVVESTGNYYGYEQYWSNSEVQLINQSITYNKPGKMPEQRGDVTIGISATTTKQLKYYENKPTQISFEGGYTQFQYNENILQYTANLVELDKNKEPTSKTVKYKNSLKMESFPQQTKLLSPPLNKIKGHPLQEEMSIMFGLGAYKEPPAFVPQEYINRAEFVDAFVKIAKEVPIDPALAPKTTSSSKAKKTTVTSPFLDVSTNHEMFESINEAAKRGFVVGTGKNSFRPDAKITVAEAVTILINSIGLQDIAPNPTAITSFKDDASIPEYARAAFYVADKLNLIEGDKKGNINPGAYITKAEAAKLFKSYIDYMSESIRTEYMQKIISY